MNLNDLNATERNTNNLAGVTKRRPGFRLNSISIFIMLAIPLSQSAISRAQAIEPSFSSIHYESAELTARVALVDSLPSELVDNINKGVPVLFQYRIEFWRERKGWPDELRNRLEISYKVRFDPWDKKYAVVRQSTELTVENQLRSQREALDMIRTSGLAVFEAADTVGMFYLVGEVMIKTMSFSNFKEVESWLKGGVSEIEKPRLKDAPDRIGEFVFDIALRVTGFKNRSETARSRRFSLGGSGVVFESE